MQKYQDILFVSTGIKDETEALKQALSIARNHQANLTALIIYPEFPARLAEYEKKHKQLLKDELYSAMQKVGAEIGFDTDSMTVAIETETKNKPAISIVKRVLKDSANLVIKQAEQKNSGAGFKALDMDLLRQCPCPVWLCRPIESSRQNIKIAVAVEAESEAEEGRDLSIQILQAADMLAGDCNNIVSIISCWDYEYEEYLRHNPWSHVPEEELKEIIKETEEENLSALSRLIEDAQIDSKADIHHVKGRPDKLIPQFIQDHKIDIIVMGTVARSGISGALIGNTAEDILQKVSCSVVALKPKGFVSPVKTY